MKKQSLTILLIGALIVSSVDAGQYTLGRYTLDANATVSFSTRYTLYGTIGQKETDQTYTAGYQLAGGFWAPGSMCIVNLEDFAIFTLHWLDGPCDMTENNCGGADLDGDNSVSLGDLQILADTWLNVCPSGWILQ